MPRREEAELSTDIGTAGLGRWLLTYSDMITLLLIVFVLLFALSTITAAKFKQLHESVADNLGGPVSVNQPSGTGILPHQRSLVPPAQAGHALSTGGPGGSAGSLNAAVLSSGPPSTSTGASSPAALGTAQGPGAAQIAAAIQQALASQGLSGLAQVSVTERGVVVQILADEVFYATDSANPGPEGDRVIDAVASVLATIPNNVVVEGYTDNEPIIGGPYTSNWELSAVRAVNVVWRLDHVDHIAKDRLAAAGFSDTHPVASNATPAGQAQNRRIDVVVLDPGQQAA